MLIYRPKKLLPVCSNVNYFLQLMYHFTCICSEVLQWNLIQVHHIMILLTGEESWLLESVWDICVYATAWPMSGSPLIKMRLSEFQPTSLFWACAVKRSRPCFMGRWWMVLLRRYILMTSVLRQWHVCLGSYQTSKYYGFSSPELTVNICNHPLSGGVQCHWTFCFKQHLHNDHWHDWVILFQGSSN